MIPASAVLVLVAAVLLVLGLVGDGVGLLLASMATAAVAGVLLAVGVAQQRPRPGGALAGEPTAWSGARRGDGEDAADPDDAARLDADLADVPEVGPGERDALLAHFGGYRWVRVATVDALAAVPGITPEVAERIHTRLQR